MENNGTSPEGGTSNGATSVDPAVLEKIEKVRDHVRDSFGKVTMAMMAMPRYRHQTLADLNHLVLDPLIRDRLAIAYAPKQEGKLSDVAGFAIWASVSEDVDAKIREQIKAGVFPVRLKAEDWSSGSINWLFDVIAPDPKTTARVIANFGALLKGGDLRMHPIVSRLVDKETLEKMGATQSEPQPGTA
ncbi:MAG: toxin-activating lysine-acyltransferase [Aliishimia sp.]